MPKTDTPLEQDIEFLKELDRFRVESAKWRSQGRAALRASFEEPSEPHPAIPWEQADISRYPLLLKALSYPEFDRKMAQLLVTELGSVSCQYVLGESPANIFLVQGDEYVPLLSRARAVIALASARNGAFSPSMMYFYYAVVRELYYADSPEWCVGGARAAADGRVSAYATNLHVRAVMSFARSIDRTAEFIEALAESAPGPSAPSCLSAWERQDSQRQSLAFYLTTGSRSWNLTLDVADKIDEPFMAQTAAERFRQLREAIHDALRRAKEVFESGSKEIVAFREREESDGFIDAASDDSAKARRKKQVARSAHAHTIALAAIDDAVRMADDALELFQAEADPMAELAKRFRKAAARVRKVAEPAVNYLSAILDRELTNATSGGGFGAFSACDLAFAATSVGAARGWEDGRLRRAGEILSNSVAENGELTFVRPYHVTPEGGSYQPPPAEAIAAYAQLLEQVPKIPIDVVVLERFANFFKVTRNDIGDKHPLATWRSPHIDRVQKHSYLFTSTAVIALDRINRMLDARINERVLTHFSHRRPSLALNQLFYGDYGLCEPAVPGQQALRKDSIAILLQRMYAHVRRVKLPEGQTACFSIVMHGPPGSGKTTMIEALARTCDVELVEVTPSDIVVGGQDAVERRARAVFTALSLLTRVVILFDEFDPVLRSRDANDGSTPTVFSFLTPGLLPKLKELHDLAEKRSVAYALITNLVGSLDAAAIRSGRFDLPIGIYPPDLLSRFGQLWTQFHSQGKKLDAAKARRFCDAITFTAGVPMQELTRKGWFIAVDEAPRGSIFKYFDNNERPQWPEPQVAPAAVQGSGRAAEREHKEWTQLSAWERRTDDARDDRAWLAAIHDELADPAGLVNEPVPWTSVPSTSTVEPTLLPILAKEQEIPTSAKVPDPVVRPTPSVETLPKSNKKRRRKPRSTPPSGG